MSDAVEYLKKVEAKAKEMYAMSDQGEWEDLGPTLQQMWISQADRELKAENGGLRG